MAALGRTYRLENAYVKIHSGTFAGYYGKDGIAALTFRLQASLAVCYLKSECYDDVILITDAALKISHDYRDSTHAYNREFRRKWREDQRLDYQRVHQCRALAHKHMGDMVQAVEHMEKALEFDPGDGNVFAQLGRLKEQLEEEVAEHGSHAILAPPDKDESS